MTAQCSSCGGFCGKVCKREDVLAQLEQYSDIVSNGGLDPRNKFDGKREWVGLTVEEHNNLWLAGLTHQDIDLVEAKLKEKNT